MKNEELIKYALVGAGGYLLYNHFTNPKPKTTPKAFLDKWLSTVATGDPGRVTSLYADDAILLPTVSSDIAVGKNNIKLYFDTFLLQSPVGVVNDLYTRLEDKGNIAIIDGNYTFTLTGPIAVVDDVPNAEQTVVPARFTFVLKNVNGDWKILTQHSSVKPE